MGKPDPPKAVVVAGPTGSGKSALALAAALKLDGAIVNADSLAFYRGFDIGTAKPGAEERSLVPHHLFDILDPEDPFDARRYMDLARPLVKELWEGGTLPLVVGGTGLYIRSLVQGLFEGPGADPLYRAELRRMEREGTDLHRLLESLDPEAAAEIRPRDKVRLERALEVLKNSGEGITSFRRRHALKDQPFRTLNLVVTVEKDALDAILRERVRGMLRAGLVDEVRGLLSNGRSPDLKPFQAVGYRETLECLGGEADFSLLEEKIYLRTRQLAKRQRSWLKKQLPDPVAVPPDPEAVVGEIKKFLAR
ncbi:MAG: tRNA (adenosine(37)-N6)-dimethylallyltransferase MiaA [Deltaproteobacteria bacterium]|jgi:tRNA dimethylallyltransferase|nr:tRNA (adenosine(37)-N6)-dimethylallyltransferase MiaA [Deltaproteobacteria bacterium]